MACRAEFLAARPRMCWTASGPWLHENVYVAYIGAYSILWKGTAEMTTSPVGANWPSFWRMSCPKLLLALTYCILYGSIAMLWCILVILYVVHITPDDLLGKNQKKNKKQTNYKVKPYGSLLQ